MRLTRREFLALATASALSTCRASSHSESIRCHIWGEQGLRNGAFQRPRAIGVKGDDVYVIDTTGRVQVFDVDGVYRRGWSTPESENGTPTGVAFGIEDRVLIPDTHYSRILEYTPDGRLLEQWGSYGTGENEFIYPTDIVQAANGNYYISEYGLDTDRVHAFDKDRRFLRQWGRQGEAEGEFSRLMAIGLDSQARLYVADTANHRVQCFSQEGAFVQAIGGGGAEPGKLKFPYDLAMAPDDSILLSEYGNHRISRFTSDGAFVGCYGRPGRGPGEFNGPRGVAVSQNGLVFVADTDNHRVQRIPLEALC